MVSRLWRLGLDLTTLILLLLLSARYVYIASLWWVQLLAVGLPLGMGFYSVLLLLGWTRIGWARRTIALLVFLIFLSRFGPWWGNVQSPHDAEGSTLKVFSYNVFQTRLDALGQAQVLVDTLMTLEPDVVALQEWWANVRRDGTPVGRTSSQMLVRQTGLKPHGNIRLPSAQMPLGTLFTRCEAAEAEVIPLPRDPYRRFMARRFSRVVCDIDGVPVALYNVHLETYGADKPWDDDALRDATHRRSRVRDFLQTYRLAIASRENQAWVVRKRLEEEPLPFILLGDFNATRHQHVYREIAAGYSDVCVGRSWLEGGTYHTALPLVTIDFIITSKHFRTEECRIVDLSVSDHRPQFASIVFLHPPQRPQ